jgi:hypothetical protein
MTYSDEYKVCWFTPQRTATRTTHTLLKKLGFLSLNTHSFRLPSERFDYQLISNIRNPYSRMVSLFFLYSLHKLNYGLNFELWCEYALNDQQFANDYQLRYDLKIKSAGRDFNKFIRVETYAEDIKSLNFIDLSKPEVYEVYQNNILKNGYTHEFKKIQTEERQRWQDFYNQKIADLVFSKLEDQFNFFDYNRNSWKDGTS